MGHREKNGEKRISQWIKDHKYQIFVFALIVLIHEFLNLQFKGLTQFVGYDEPSTIGWVSSFDDVDWGDVVSTNKYYGFGFAWIYSVLYVFFSDPLVIYQLMLLSIAVLYGFAGILCYKTVNTIVHLKNSREQFAAAVISVAAVFIPVKFVYVFNEHMYIFLNWCIVYLLVKMIESNGKKHRYGILLLLVLGYSLTIHEKAITVWAGCILTVLLVRIVFRKKIISLPAFFVSDFVIYRGLKKVVRTIQKSIWSSSGSTLANTSDSTFSMILNKLPYLKNPKNWIFPIATFLSQIYFASMTTGGMFLIGLVISLYLIVYFMVKRSDRPEDIMIFAVAFYTIACVFVTIGVQCVTWMPDVADYGSSDLPLAIWGGRAKLYLRYFCCYCGPMLMLVFVYAYRYSHLLKKSYKYIAVLYMALTFFVAMKVSLWYDELKMNSSPVYTMFLPFVLGKSNDYLTRNTFLAALVSGTVIFLLLYFIYTRGRKTLWTVMVCALLVYQYLYTGITVYKTNSEQNYLQYYPVYELLSSIESPEIDTVYMPQAGTNTVRLKFFLTEFTILIEKPDLSEEGVVVLFRSDGFVNTEYTSQGFQYYLAGSYEVYLSEDIQLDAS